MLWVLIRMSTYTICFMEKLFVLSRLAEAILISTHDKCFYGEWKKVIPKLLSNTNHLLLCFIYKDAIVELIDTALALCCCVSVIKMGV